MKMNIVEYLLESVGKFPQKLAVEDESRAITYLELLVAGNRLSKLLLCSGVQKKTPVAILMPKTCEAIVSIVATSMTGAIYVPLDTSSPIERLRAVIDQLGDARLICCESTMDLANSVGIDAARVVCIPENLFHETVAEDVDELISGVEDKLKDVIDLDPCYVIFTSGSTGIPKGVTIAHRSVIDYIDWAKKEYTVCERHRIASQAPLYFDNSTLDLYLTFSTGASLHIPQDRIYAFPKLILDYIDKKKITTIFWVPSVLISIANSGLLEKISPKSIEHVLFAGEQMPVPQINSWVRALPGVLFSNLYGPTEITVDCTSYTFYEPYKGDVLPIGYACRNSNILIINEFEKECEPDEIGELCVRGTSLALGYWNDSERTNEVFKQNPLENRFRDIIYRTGDLARRDRSGCITFIGRRDSQVKLNGYRIELGEIEAAAIKLVGVACCAAIFDKNRKAIILFVEFIPGHDLELASLRRGLSGLIPKYMMPTEVRVVSAFKLNKNGKIDRAQLMSNFDVE